MKSKTSFSKLTPFIKDITRFAPVWGLYLVGLLMILVNIITSYDSNTALRPLPGIIISFGIVNLIYAAVCAQVLFGDLFNTKMCYSLHALPQRRETWLLSHFASGFLFSLVPNFLGCLAIMPFIEQAGYAVFWVLLAMELQFLFYFGLAAVSAMVTGNRFAMLLVYGGLNFVSMLVYWVISAIYLPLLEGVALDFGTFRKLCPTVELFRFEFMKLRRVEIYDIFNEIQRHGYEFQALSDGWGYLAVLGILGLVFMGAAAILYRRRHLESAGDFVSFPKLKVPMLVVMTVCVGGVAAVMGDLVFGDSMWLWLTVGILVGYFGGMMLLERRIKVFRLKSIIGFAVLAVVLACSYLLTAADAFGLERWTPEAHEVKSVTVSNLDTDYSYYSNRIIVTLEEKEEIRDIIEAHRDIIRRLNDPHNSTHRVVITYHMESGRTVKRTYYRAPASGRNYEIIQKYFYTDNQILGYDDWDEFVENMELLHIGGNDLLQTHYEKVLNAIRSDCTQGNIRPEHAVNGVVEGYVYYQSGDVHRGLGILPGAEKTKALLCQPEIVLGYENWDGLLEALNYIDVEGKDVKKSHHAGLMEAMRADCEKGNLSLLDPDDCVYWVEYHSRGLYRYLPIPREATETIAYIEKYILN